MILYTLAITGFRKETLTRERKRKEKVQQRKREERKEERKDQKEG